MAGRGRQLRHRHASSRRMAGAHHACHGTRSRPRGNPPRAGGCMKLRWPVVAALVVCLIALAVFMRKRGDPVPVHLAPEPAQPRVSPAEGGVAVVGLEAAAAYAADRNTQALVGGRGGHIVYEKYWGDTHFDSVVDAGFAPVLSALVVGTALNDRLIHSLDAPLSEFVPGLAAPESSFTLRGLMARDEAGLSLEDSTDVLAL